jgi:hypothetical protein
MNMGGRLVLFARYFYSLCNSVNFLFHLHFYYIGKLALKMFSKIMTKS